MAAAVRLARPSSRRRQPVSDHRGSAREDEQEARVKGAAHRSFLNHLLSSTSISVQSGRFSSLYTVPLDSASRLRSPSERVTLTFSVARHSKVTKTFSRRCAQIRFGIFVAMSQCLC